MAPYSGELNDELPVLPVMGKVTLLDFGSDSCAPCKMLSPIIRRLKKEYSGKAAIYFVDVKKSKALAAQHRVRAIPTLVFFDAGGREVFRHVGFLDEFFIEKRLKKLGVE